MKSTIDREPVSWDIDLTPLIDVPVEIETTDGIYRKTTITGLHCKDVNFNGVICPVPQRLLLEGSEADYIELNVVKTVKKL